MRRRIEVFPAGFLSDMWRAFSWRVLLGALAFGVVISLGRLLMAMPFRVELLIQHLISELLTAPLMVFAALAADQAIRRGRGVLRSFAVALGGATVASVGLTMLLQAWLGVGYKSAHALIMEAIGAINGITTFWGMAMLVFLNQRSAARMLSGVRATELERVRIEHRLIDSRLSAAEAQVDPAQLKRRLGQIRALYAEAQPDAEPVLESLIEDLRHSIYLDNVNRPPESMA